MYHKMAVWMWSLLFLAGAVSAQPSRIVGGEPTTIDRYPSIVQVDSLGIFNGVWGQSCAANILNNRYVLTAAHCFAGLFYFGPEYRRIRAGSTYRNNGGVIIYVEREINHPSYGRNGYDGDISVVRLSTTLIYTPVIQRGAIAPQGTVMLDFLPVVHAGWGAIAQNGPASSVLRDVTIFTINNDLCRELYLTLPNPGTVTENMICAGIQGVGGKDACQADSGGPLYFGSTIVGIASWGHGCANETFPGVSTAVGPYTDWVASTAV